MAVCQRKLESMMHDKWDLKEYLYKQIEYFDSILNGDIESEESDEFIKGHREGMIMVYRYYFHEIGGKI
jgi:hypothetical protein